MYPRALGILAGAGGLSLAAWHRLFRRPLPQTRGELHVKGLESRGAHRPRRARRAAHRRPLAHRPGVRAGLLPRARTVSGSSSSSAARPPGASSEFAGEEGVQVRPADAHARPAPARAARGRASSTRGSGTCSTPTPPASTRRSSRANALPLELQLLRIEPEPWTPGRLAGHRQADRARLLDEHGGGAVPRRPDRARRRGEGGAARAALPAGLAGRDRSPACPWYGRRARRARRSSSAVREALGLGSAPAGLEQLGRVGRRARSTGKPLLAGDPHISSDDAVPLVPGRAPGARRST